MKTFFTKVVSILGVLILTSSVLKAEDQAFGNNYPTHRSDCEGNFVITSTISLPSGRDYYVQLNPLQNIYAEYKLYKDGVFVASTNGNGFNPNWWEIGEFTVS